MHAFSIPVATTIGSRVTFACSYIISLTAKLRIAAPSQDLFCSAMFVPVRVGINRSVRHYLQDSESLPLSLRLGSCHSTNPTWKPNTHWMQFPVLLRQRVRSPALYRIVTFHMGEQQIKILQRVSLDLSSWRQMDSMPLSWPKQWWSRVYSAVWFDRVYMQCCQWTMLSVDRACSMSDFASTGRVPLHESQGGTGRWIGRWTILRPSVGSKFPIPCCRRVSRKNLDTLLYNCHLTQKRNFPDADEMQLQSTRELVEVASHSTWTEVCPAFWLQWVRYSTKVIAWISPRVPAG